MSAASVNVKAGPFGGYSSYEITAECQTLRILGKSNRQIAVALGKSETWVSRHMSAWHNATPDLKSAWASGMLSDEQVIRIAGLIDSEQRRALADGAIPAATKRKGRSLRAVEQARARLTSSTDYERGMAAALDWVMGRTDELPGGDGPMVEPGNEQDHRPGSRPDPRSAARARPRRR